MVRPGSPGGGELAFNMAAALRVSSLARHQRVDRGRLTCAAQVAMTVSPFGAEPRRCGHDESDRNVPPSGRRAPAFARSRTQLTGMGPDRSPQLFLTCLVGTRPLSACIEYRTTRVCSPGVHRFAIPRTLAPRRRVEPVNTAVTSPVHVSSRCLLARTGRGTRNHHHRRRRPSGVWCRPATRGGRAWRIGTIKSRSVMPASPSDSGWRERPRHSRTVTYAHRLRSNR